MSKARIKLAIWALLLAMAISAAAWVVSATANLLASFQRGADPASALNIVPNVAPDLSVARAWLPDGPGVQQAPDPYTREQIETAYLRAWLQWNLSYVKGEPHGLKTYFTGPALEAAGAAVRQATARGLRVDQVDTRHAFQLHLYGAGGTVAAFTDRGAEVAQVIRDARGAVLYAGETAADYDVVMVLEDGLWHVRHWLRRPSTDPAPPPAAPCAGCVTLAPGGAGLIADGAPFQVAGINYYPGQTPWDAFWPAYRPAVIDRDLTRIKGLGLNTVRIFVPYQQFGGPRVEPQLLARLADFLDRAHAQGLRVIVTLFDFRADYGLLRWADADRHMAAILGRFSSHPAVLAWDLKNEPDLDDGRAGREVVDAWLAHALRTARRYDPNHLVTIGWSSPAAAARLAGEVDLVQYHYYALAGDLPAAHRELRAAAPGRPILMGEFGLPTWNTVLPNGHTEAEQAAYYAAVLAALRQTDSAGYLAWTLYDFARVPASVAGPWPWQTGPQSHMGVLRADETAKPAAALLAPGATLAPQPPAWWQRFLKPFWLALALALALAALGARRLLRRAPRPAADREHLPTHTYD